MAKRNTTSPEEAKSIVTFAHTATGVSGSSAFFPGGINVSVWGTFVGTVQIERSFDGGAIWLVVDKDLTGADLTFTAPQSLVVEEVESAVLYRSNCTAFTSGTINVRLSQG
jgi:hypothetical protein